LVKEFPLQWSTPPADIVLKFGSREEPSKPMTYDPKIPPVETANGDDPRRIPQAVVKRLSLYSRVLQNLERDKVDKVSSTELAELLGLNSAQVRKDLATFGQFGIPGYGYQVGDLRHRIKSILGTDRDVAVALIGVGHLGTALLSYGGFQRQGFRVMCAFDIAINDVDHANLPVPIYLIGELEGRIKQHGIDMAILTVPQDAAQTITDRLVEAGITAILNFVPTRLRTPDHVKVHYVDLAIEMESLSFYLK